MFVVSGFRCQIHVQHAESLNTHVGMHNLNALKIKPLLLNIFTTICQHRSLFKLRNINRNTSYFYLEHNNKQYDRIDQIEKSSTEKNQDEMTETRIFSIERGRLRQYGISKMAMRARNSQYFNNFWQRRLETTW